MAYSKEKQKKLMTSLTNIGSLVGTNNTGVANGIKGLEMGLEQSKCDEQAKAVHDGLFKVAIMGTFSSGKSTVINALVGSKILPESALPCTAILTFIQYGTNEDCVNVYMADEIQKDGSVKTGECRQMSVKDFQEEYKYTIEDEKQFKETGTVKRFAKVKYAIMYCSKPLMEGGVTIIDSPGLEDKQVATDLAMKIAQEAQAIIYAVTDRGSSSTDKEYIPSVFRNCPDNVFFLLNKFDLVKKEDRQQAKDKFKLDLNTVFTNENGQFDNDLYNRRVFGISALRALDSRRGKTYDTVSEEERTLTAAECQQMYENSWFKPFEEELEKFLTTDEKCIAQYRKCFSQMASTYKNAQAQIDEYLNVYENELQMDEAQKVECAKIMDDIRKSIKATETTFDNCSLKIQNKVADVLNGCAGTIDNSWENDMETLADSIDVSTLQYMWKAVKMMNPLASKEAKQKEIEEFSGMFVTAVSEYFVKKVEDYIAENRAVIDKEVEECEKALNVQLSGTESLFDDLSRKITNGSTPSATASDQSWLQLLISASLGDLSAVVREANEGKAPWVEFLKKTIFNTVWQAVVLSFASGGLGFLLVVGIEYFQSKKNKNETVKKMLSGSKDNMVRSIRQMSSETQDKINKQIAVTIDKKKKETSKDMTQKLSDEQKKMDTINSTLSDHNFNLEAEKERFNTILSAIYNEAKESYSVVFGQELSLQQFNAF